MILHVLIADIKLGFLELCSMILQKCPNVDEKSAIDPSHCIPPLQPTEMLAPENRCVDLMLRMTIHLLREICIYLELFSISLLRFKREFITFILGHSGIIFRGFLSSCLIKLICNVQPPMDADNIDVSSRAGEYGGRR